MIANSAEIHPLIYVDEGVYFGETTVVGLYCVALAGACSDVGGHEIRHGNSAKFFRGDQ